MAVVHFAQLISAISPYLKEDFGATVRMNVGNLASSIILREARTLTMTFLVSKAISREARMGKGVQGSAHVLLLVGE